MKLEKYIKLTTEIDKIINELKVENCNNSESAISFLSMAQGRINLIYRNVIEHNNKPEKQD